MIELFKYTHHMYDMDRPTFPLNAARETRGNTLKLMKTKSRLDLRANFFSQRVVATWNGLPESVVTAPTVNTFKNRLDQYWKDHPSVYNPQCYN